MCNITYFNNFLAYSSSKKILVTRKAEIKKHISRKKDREKMEPSHTEENGGRYGSSLVC